MQRYYHIYIYDDDYTKYTSKQHKLNKDILFYDKLMTFLDASKCQCIFIQNAFTNGVTFNYINGYKSRFILLLPSVCCLIDINANLITINLFDGIAVLSDVNMKGEVIYGTPLLCHIMTITKMHMLKRIFITIIPLSWLSISHTLIYYGKYRIFLRNDSYASVPNSSFLKITMKCITPYW